MGNLKFSRIDYQQLTELESFATPSIFQTVNWLNFVKETQDAEPVVAVIENENIPVGYFTGLIIKKFGLRILGSPFPGWTTSYMGFNLHPSIRNVDALIALENFAFNDLNCIHLEIMNRHLNTDDLLKAGYKCDFFPNFEIDLSQDEDHIFASMSSSCRWSIRKAKKLGVSIEIAEDLSFADDYYSQLQDVFAKQKLVPTYPKERVKSLIRNLLPTSQLLLLRAKDGNNNCIATGIFPALNDTMFFWGGASYRTYQDLRPNEALIWFAMRYWKSRGVSILDMAGARDYKRKYGVVSEIAIPWGRKSKYHTLEKLRNFGKFLADKKQKLAGLNKS
ncbi:GNAT family N-acetyltransferase [Calothrix sp. UHCC 0171]|uniref:GNAT family N-acetyltransferase n=1 Tax=Calothrix sp. UHCC 0171 TaxID=3110245 RepID=UPI002B1F46EB|nr:GNAT family N-acetyltransferase [Calothrix sp. UHCC 0171]MEA5571821.1 GNAT family N-acetyltransferase [Calothrix sp. UHCC 0171]